MWGAGCQGPDGKIYCPPLDANTILVIEVRKPYEVRIILTTHGGYIADTSSGMDFTSGILGDFGWYSGGTRIMYLNSAGALYVNGNVLVMGRNRSSATATNGVSITNKWGGEIIAQFSCCIHDTSEGAIGQLQILNGSGTVITTANAYTGWSQGNSIATNVGISISANVGIGTVLSAQFVWLNGANGTIVSPYLTIYET